MQVATNEQQPQGVRLKDSSKPFFLAPAQIAICDSRRRSLCGVWIAEQVRSHCTTRSVTNSTTRGRIPPNALLIEFLGDQVGIEHFSEAHKTILQRANVYDPLGPRGSIGVLD